MDPRILKYYNRELQHLREMAGEFAKEFPKIASRLTLDGFECADPYVERLLEGFAFLTARVQLEIDSQFPRFTQHLLEIVYPHYLAPTPSMAMVQIQPDLTEGGLADGFVVPRGSILRAQMGKGDQTGCEYRTGHDVTLWPLSLVEAEGYPAGREAAVLDDLGIKDVKSVVRLRLRTSAGAKFEKLALDRLPIFIRGAGEVPGHIYEQLLTDTVAVLARPSEFPAPWCEVIDKKHIVQQGFEDDQGLLPYDTRSFQGYRLLHEYFAFPERYLILELGGLARAVQRHEGQEMDLLFLLNRSDPVLEGVIDEGQFALFCTPAVNIIERRADRIHLTEGRPEHHIVPDRTRPLDYEVYQVLEVSGHGTSAEDEQEFLPFYAVNDLTMHQDHAAYYITRRMPRMLSSKQRRYGPRTSYIGSEVNIALVDTAAAPYRTSLKQLSLRLLCTNRDLPLTMPLGMGETDFTLEIGAPVKTIRAVAGPTKPHPPLAQGDDSWRLVSHLSLNYLSLLDSDSRHGAAALRELLGLYSGEEDAATTKQLEALLNVRSRHVVRRLPLPGMATFARGIEIGLKFNERGFGGAGVVLMSAVLERFFAKYVSINSFTETIVESVERGEVIRWPLRAGLRHTT